MKTCTIHILSAAALALATGFLIAPNTMAADEITANAPATQPDNPGN
jgi:hypothetical protein